MSPKKYNNIENYSDPGGSFLTPELTHQEMIDKLSSMSEWLENIGVKFAHTRLPEYKKFLEKLPPPSSLNPIENDEHHKLLDRYIFAAREIGELFWIFDTFRKAHTLPPGALPRLQAICRGQLFGKDDKDSRARDVQLELRIASHFLRCGYDIDLSQEADIYARSSTDRFFVECKRLSSPKKSAMRIKEAAKQLEKRTKKRFLQKDLGIAVFDVTRLAFPNLGMTWGITPEDCKFAIRSKLKEVLSQHDFTTPLIKNKNVILIWVQVFVPTIAASTGQPASRASSIFLPLAPKGGSRAEAFERLKNVLEVGVRV